MNDRDRAALETLVHENLVHHALGAGSSREDFDPWWDRLLELVEAFPDLAVDLEDLAVDGDLVMGRATLSGTFEAPLDGQAPSGRSATAAAFHALRFEDGRVVEWWRLTDVLGWGLDLGALPLGPRALANVALRQLRWQLGDGRRRRS